MPNSMLMSQEQLAGTNHRSMRLPIMGAAGHSEEDRSGRRAVMLARALKRWGRSMWRCFVSALMLLSAMPSARAEYPDRTVHIVVPVAAGGGIDVMARMLAQKLSERLGQQFVVENRP